MPIQPPDRPAPTVVDIGTPVGTARAHLHPASPKAAESRRPVVLVLGHGAGGGIGARDLAALAATLPAAGVTVILVEQPWRVGGGTVASAPPRLDLAWTAVLAAPELADVLRPAGGLLAVGGRSAGARVACRTAAATGADHVVCLAFPLHPPGRPERSRADELTGSGTRALVLQGERDTFGGPDQVTAAVRAAGQAAARRTRVVPVPYADHGFKVPAGAPLTQAGALEIVSGEVTRWLLATERHR